MIARSAKLIWSIPKELGNCKKLTHLHLSFNAFTSSIPKELAGLEAIAHFAVEGNKLSDWIQHHGSLDLSHNRLTGCIPPTIKNYVILEEVHLQGNLLNGSIPTELGELKNLRTVDLSFNALVGPMPSWSAPLLSLQGLFLSNNHLIGNIPVEIGHILPTVVVINLSSNAFFGYATPIFTAQQEPEPSGCQITSLVKSHYLVLVMKNP